MTNNYTFTLDAKNTKSKLVMPAIETNASQYIIEKNANSELRHSNTKLNTGYYWPNGKPHCGDFCAI